MEKIKGILKYIGKVISFTLLVIVIVSGLFLLYVFVSAKLANSNGTTPSVNLYTIISPSMTPNIKVYDVVVTVKTDVSTLKEGDIITFYSDNPNLNGYTTTHRIINVFKNGDSYSFQTKGDYNKAPDSFIVPSQKIVGKVIFKIPQLGRVQFFLASKGGWILAVLIPALAIIAYDIYKIIKLVMIKQKIVDFQNEEELSQNKENIAIPNSEIVNNDSDKVNQENQSLVPNNIQNEKIVPNNTESNNENFNDVFEIKENENINETLNVIESPQEEILEKTEEENVIKLDQVQNQIIENVNPVSTEVNNEPEIVNEFELKENLDEVVKSDSYQDIEKEKVNETPEVVSEPKLIETEEEKVNVPIDENDIPKFTLPESKEIKLEETSVNEAPEISIISNENQMNEEDQIISISDDE